ncbi:MAG: alpha/beta fold hydrolase [Myxococcota bacterium]
MQRQFNTQILEQHPHLCYERLGEGPCIVLIMGIGAQLVHWPDEFCKHFVEAGFSVLRFDNRDMGQSKRWTKGGLPNIKGMIPKRLLGMNIQAKYKLEDMADDVIGLMNALDIETAGIVGISMGSMIAQIVAAQYPHRCRHLTLIMSNSGERRTLIPTPKALMALVDVQHSPDRETAQDNIVRLFSVIGSPAYPLDEDRLRRLGGLAFDRGKTPDGFARQFAAVLSTGSRSHYIQKIKCPTLLIHGKDDPLIPLTAGKRIKALLPSAEHWWVEGMGHDLPQLLWPEFAKRIMALEPT